jgi:hypothetical protein
MQPFNFGAVNTLVLLYLSERRRPFPLRLHDLLLCARLPGLQRVVRGVQRLPCSFAPVVQRIGRERLPPAISIQGSNKRRQAALEVRPPHQQRSMLDRGHRHIVCQPL